MGKEKINIIIDSLKSKYETAKNHKDDILAIVYNKTVMLLVLLFPLFLIICHLNSLFIIATMATLLHISFKFYTNLENIKDDSLSNVKTLGYFYLLLPFVATSLIYNKLGHNFCLWFLTLIVYDITVERIYKLYTGKVQEELSPENNKNETAPTIDTESKNPNNIASSKSSSENTQPEPANLLTNNMLLYKLGFLILHSLLFKFFIDLSLLKIISLNLLIELILFLEKNFMIKVKNFLQIRNNQDILFELDRFILTGILVNMLHIMALI